MAAQRTYVATALAFADLIRTLPADRLAGPGLGEWTVRDLLGHTSAGLVTVIEALDRQATTEDITTPEGYYALAKTVDPAVYQAVVALSSTDARERGALLGDRPADPVRRLVDRAVAAVAATDPAALVTTAAGAMRLARWLPTRTFELVVHGMDIATAALTGRRELPAGFSVI